MPLSHLPQRGIERKGLLADGHMWAIAKVKDSDMPEIDDRANFWVAVDYFVRAKQADPSWQKNVTA